MPTCFADNEVNYNQVIFYSLGYDLYLIEDFIPTELTPEIHQEILNQLVQDWLQSELE